MIEKILNDVCSGIYNPPAVIFSTTTRGKRLAAGPPSLKVSLMTASVHFMLLNFY